MNISHPCKKRKGGAASECDRFKENEGVGRSIFNPGGPKKIWCREQDLNLHAFWALDPKSNASANSAIPALGLF